MRLLNYVGIMQLNYVRTMQLNYVGITQLKKPDTLIREYRAWWSSIGASLFRFLQRYRLAFWYRLQF